MVEQPYHSRCAKPPLGCFACDGWSRTRNAMTPQLSPGRVMLYTACVLAVLGMAWILIHIRAIILLLVLGILFAAAIEPLVFRLRRRGMTRGQAILSVYVGLIFGLALVFYLIVP